MLVEIHMIQNHSPANLNRNDLNAPKTCIFGDYTRARISSQCIKRSIRRSPEFQAALEKEGGIRTRRLITVLAEKASGQEQPPEDLVELVAKAFEEGGVKRDPTPEDKNATNILLFLPESAMDKMADAVKTASAQRLSAEKLAQNLAGILGEFAAVPDIALSGRMTEVDRSGLFADLKLNVEAALSAAHAISTHAVVNDTDYFVAVDDLSKGTGAGHVNEAMFNSACFYKYFSLKWDILVSNLMPPGADGKAKETAWRLGAATLGHFLRAAARTTPSGKQHSFASNCEPCGILVEIKKHDRTPTSYANAFAEPARKIGVPPDDAPDCVSLLGRSIAQLGDHAYSLRRAYGTESTVLWYSPELWRYPLQGWEREADGRKAKVPDDKGNPSSDDKPPVQFANRCLDILGGEEGRPAGLVEAVVKEVSGLDWGQVRDAGRKCQEEVAR